MIITTIIVLKPDHMIKSLKIIPHKLPVENILLEGLNQTPSTPSSVHECDPVDISAPLSEKQSPCDIPTEDNPGGAPPESPVSHIVSDPLFLTSSPTVHKCVSTVVSEPFANKKSPCDIPSTANIAKDPSDTSMQNATQLDPWLNALDSISLIEQEILEILEQSEQKSVEVNSLKPNPDPPPDHPPV